MNDAKALGAMLLGLLVSGCSSAHDCAPIGCSAAVTLSGNVALNHTVEAVDTLFCQEGSCDEARLQLSSEEQRCSERGQVQAPDDLDGASRSLCLSSKQGSLDVYGSWSVSSGSGASYRVLLKDAASGQVLLDETRRVTPQNVFGDGAGCGECFSANAKL